MAITRTQIAKQLLEQGGRVGLRFGSEGYQGGATNQGGAGRGTDVGRSGGEGNRDRRRVEQYTKPPTTVGGSGGKTSDTPLKFKKDIPDNFAKKLKIEDFINLNLIDDEQENMQVADVSASDINRLLGTNPYGKQKYSPEQDIDTIRTIEGQFLNPTITDKEIKDVLQGTITGPTGKFLKDGGRIGAMGGGRAQQARQMYRTAGAVQAAYGAAAAEKGPVEDKGNPQQDINQINQTVENLGNIENIQKAFDTAADINYLKNIVQGSGAKGVLSAIGGPLIIGNILKRISQSNRNKSMTIDDSEKESFADGGNVVGGEFDFESARQMYGLGKLVKKVTRSVKKIAKSPIGKAALLYTGVGGLGNLAAGKSFFGGSFANVLRPTQFLGNVPSIFSREGLKNIAFGTSGEFLGTPRGPNTGILTKGTSGLFGVGGEFSPLKAISATSAVAGFLTPEEEDEAQQIADNTGIDIEIIRANPNQYLGRRFRAEGGSMKEPVAKKTMPLLDMNGQEMDLRAEGGFVPIGRMEKADDVPARLSKNEFVFTADAVRNAGDGDVDKGAEVMYNMMKNLESGGEVSEESQGLEGARKMFQTSQRLEEVL